MKKFALATIICLAFFLRGIAQTTDSVYSEMKVNGVWQKNELDILTRDASCSVVSLLALAWNESSQSWVNSFLSTYSNNNAGTSFEALTQSWDAVNNLWINNSKSFGFSSNGGSKNTYLSQTWDALSNSWINSYRLVDILDGEGRTIVNEFDLYSNNEWQKIQRGLLSYDANNHIAETIFQTWANNLWTNNSKTTYNYTGKGLMLDYLWDNGNSAWTLFRRTFNDYLNGTALSEKTLGQIVSGSTWQNNFRSKQTYNDSNLELSAFQQNWDVNTQSWINSFQQKLDYYANSNQDHYLFEFWDATTNSFSSGYRSTSTDVSCSQTLQLVPVSEIENNRGVLVQNKNGNYMVHRMPAVKTNNIQRTLNPLAGNRNSLVYDFTFNGSGNQPKQYAFELILSTAAKPQNIKSKTADNAITINKSSFILSPNPAKTYFNINLSAWKNAGDIVMKLSDISGKLIIQQKMNAGIQKVNLPALQKGVYIVSVSSGKEIQNQKLVIE